MLLVSPPIQRSLRFFSLGLFSLVLALAAQAAPNPPTNLNVFLSKKATSFTYAFLWTDTSTNETAFIISSSPGTSGTNFTRLSAPDSPTPPNSTGVTGVFVGTNVLPPGSVVQFKVESWNVTGTSSPLAPSALVTFTVPADSFNPPSAVTTSATSESVIHVSWTDNATTEDGEELEISSDGGAIFSKIADIQFYQQKSIDITGLAPGTSSYRFRLKAYKEGSPRTYTAYSTPSVVNATTPFNAPTALTATPLASGTINLSWVDNSSVEGGYLIYFRKNGAASYSLYDTTLSNVTAYAVKGLEPKANYEFKVTAGYQSIESAPSNPVNVTIPDFLVPTNLAASELEPNTESSIKLTWTDNTTLNVAYEVEAKLTSSTGEFGALADAADGTVFSMPDIFEPGTSYDFRIRPFYQEGINPRVYSNSANLGYSTPITYVTPFNAPTAPTATVVSDSQIDLTWTDNSHKEGLFAIYFRLSGTTDYFFYDFADEDATTFSATGLFAGAAYDFKISSVFYSDDRDLFIESAYTPAVSATTKDGFTSSPIVTFLPDGTYAYTATTSSKASSRTTWSATNLPAGLDFNTTTGAITGTPLVFGVRNATLSATFSDNRTTILPLTFRIVRPPAPPLVGTPIGAQTVTPGTDASIDLTGKFSDLDTESAVRVVTNKGTMDFILYNAATPDTVDNFMSYVTANSYNGSIFHRSEPGFIIQGGAYKVVSPSNNFSASPTGESPYNEPGISNLRGTVAMAKVGNNPNSATNQFFVNLADNGSSNLDFQNGGFTVFARVANGVANGGMTAADTIAALPRGDYNVNINSTPASLAHCPIDAATAPSVMDNSKMVTMTSVAPVAVLSYSIIPNVNTNTSVVGASINGTNLVLHPLSGGQSSITLRATDLDGNSVDQTFTVTVNQSANAWAASQGLSGNDALPDADPDGDGLSNFHEFSFMSHPNSSASSARPSFTTVTTVGAIKRGEITFPVRKFTTGLTYIVEASGTLLPDSWTTLWTSSAGFGAANVSAAVDQADRTMVTIQDIEDSPPAQRRFLRVRVTSP